MLGYAKIDPSAVATYHTENPLLLAKAVKQIKGRPGYTNVKSSISKEGVLDPVIVRCEPSRVYVEVGEQRVLIARELGITQLDALVYNTAKLNDDAVLPFTVDFEVTLDEAAAMFGTVEVKQSCPLPEGCSNPNCPLLSEWPKHKWVSTPKNLVPDGAEQREAAGMRMLRKYSEAGIVTVTKEG